MPRYLLSLSYFYSYFWSFFRLVLSCFCLALSLFLIGQNGCTSRLPMYYSLCCNAKILSLSLLLCFCRCLCSYIWFFVSVFFLFLKFKNIVHVFVYIFVFVYVSVIVFVLFLLVFVSLLANLIIIIVATGGQSETSSHRWIRDGKRRCSGGSRGRERR